MSPLETFRGIFSTSGAHRSRTTLLMMWLTKRLGQSVRLAPRVGIDRLSPATAQHQRRASQAAERPGRLWGCVWTRVPFFGGVGGGTGVNDDDRWFSPVRHTRLHELPPTTLAICTRVSHPLGTAVVICAAALRRSPFTAPLPPLLLRPTPLLPAPCAAPVRAAAPRPPRRPRPEA